MAGSGPQPAAARLSVSDNFNVPDLEDHFERVSQSVAPAVVAISATDTKVAGDDTLRADHINPQKLQSILEAVDRTVGTGFVIDPDGYIVTNDHVVASCDQLWVTTDDHKVYPAIIVGSDPRADIAVLKIPAHNLSVVHFANNSVRRGQWSIALGNPYGLAGGGEMSVSVGVISAIDRSLPKLSGKEDRLYYDLIQTTAQINPGNSGGPLFDIRGDVMGINTAVILPQKLTNGIGFAIPITTHVRQVIDDLKNGREVAYGWLGVHVSTPTAAECRDAGLKEEGGARVDSIEPASPASGEKITTGDIITRFNGQAITDSERFVRLVGEAPADHDASATIYHDGKASITTLHVGRRHSPAALVTSETRRFHWLGMVLGEIPKHLNLGNAPAPSAGLMVIAIDSKSPAVQQGVSQGAIITAIAGKPVRDLLQLQVLLNETSPEACAIESISPGQVASARD